MCHDEIILKITHTILYSLPMYVYVLCMNCQLLSRLLVRSGNKGWDGKPKSAGGRTRVYFIAGLVGVGAGVAYSGWKKREELKRGT